MGNKSMKWTRANTKLVNYIDKALASGDISSYTATALQKARTKLVDEDVLRGDVLIFITRHLEQLEISGTGKLTDTERKMLHNIGWLVGGPVSDPHLEFGFGVKEGED
jgi:hypothetical protein